MATPHSIPDDVLNSAVEYCIDEYVRLTRDRDMLRDHWWGGLSLTELENKYHLSLTAVKKIIYVQGDRVLVLAHKMCTCHTIFDRITLIAFRMIVTYTNKTKTAV